MKSLDKITAEQTIDVMIEFEEKGLLSACNMYNEFLRRNAQPMKSKVELMPIIKYYYIENFK